MTNRLRWLSDEADGHGWKLLARHHDAKITYVLVDEHGEMEFNTVDEVEQKIHMPYAQSSAVTRLVIGPSILGPATP
jgi:hypothetical protein